MTDFKNHSNTDLAKINDNLNNKKYRKYILLGKNDEPKGEYTGTHPKQAAKKAFTRIIRTHLNNQIHENNGVSEMLNFKIKNKTTGQIYDYSGMRVRLEHPKVVYYNGKKVTHKFRNVLART
jgi:hypothetical protein